MNFLEKKSPQNIDAEIAILNLLVSYDDLFYLFELSADDFYQEKHKIIFNAITELKQQNKKIDIVILSDYLKNNLKAVGGLTYIAKLLSSYNTKQSYKDYVVIIKNCSIRRKLIEMQMQNEKYVFNDEMKAEKILNEMQNNLNNLVVEKKEDNIQDVITKVSDLQAQFSEKYEQGKQFIGIPSGILKIDKAIDGLRPGHIWVVGGWSSTGKTMFVLNIALNILKQIPTTMISLEMSKVDLVARLIGIRHNISAMRVIKGFQNDEILKKAEEGKNFLWHSKLKIYSNYFELEKIKMLIRREVYQRNAKVFIIDYIQNMLSDKINKEYELITKAITDLQAIAGELKITILVVSQISNASEKGQGAGAGFKGSGALEAVADLAIRLKRNKQNEQPEDTDVPIDILIAKNRHGFTGLINSYLINLKSGKFYEN